MNSPVNVPIDCRPGAVRAVQARGNRAASQWLPLLLCAVVTAVAMMSFFVHVLESHVERGQRLRQAVAQGPVADPVGLSQLLQPLHVGMSIQR